MAGYSSRVKRDIGRWLQSDLIDAQTAEALSRDVEANESNLFSFGFILTVMAALLLGAAILLLVASNWEAIPRLVRVACLFAIILGGYIGGAALKLRGSDAIAEALWLIAAAAFGGSIALIGQMYHLSGDEASAVMTWCLGTALAAAALRSGPLTIAAAGIAIAWMVLSQVEYWDGGRFPFFYLAIAVVLWLVSYWTQSRTTRHLILLSLILYGGMLAVHYDDVAGIGTAMAIVSAALFAAAVYLRDPVEKIAQLGRRLPVHCLIGFLTGLALVQAEMVDKTPGLAIGALVTFAGIAAALLLAGRESRMLRWVAYAGFGLELCYVYVVMLGTMLDTAGLFLASGIVLGIIALFIIRVEKRVKSKLLEQKGAA
ncbi:DUF2157 domain-containing protein [Mesorhizobium sp. DCY119]|uniref:DUF2157 domain-containing protein n=1 Tax=Mesorhizobium sp. DCY119 TaxID=2108445 RepID=UPI000E6C1F15|nr:DUF2157 domain-containing protein [Mesorhizobium sp. DCY119]RJG45535.1 DUF2157 domain-containing protein [Mesorhizobium sp. DCY119]